MRGHSDPVTQQRAPAVRRRRVDGQHRDAQVRAPRYAATSAAIVVDLPAPGGPVTPTTRAVWQAQGAPEPRRGAGSRQGSAAGRLLGWSRRAQLDELIDGHASLLQGSKEPVPR